MLYTSDWEERKYCCTKWNKEHEQKENENNSVIAGLLAEVTVSRIKKPVHREAWWKALESFPLHHNVF